ncbi:response regulator [Aquibacillus albus]|uniref:Two-component system response regulator YesN n=1 Tax=Aquibacillus albus TaxID=1168171 RepID=A0ABS2N4K1_9BACI|nr:response regulator [Aquibacillus albus]MBM7573033.1 two-component system response regulator YesN [Aquibacillus albus]
MFNILVVEDEDMIRHKVLNNIDWYSNGFQQVFEAENGSEALNIMESNKIDILITDIKMPFMDGIELTKYVKECYPNIKVIIISGHADFDYARKSITLNVSHYILKPFQSKNLLKLVNEVKEELIRDLGEQEDVEKMRRQLRQNKQSLRERLIENLLTNSFVGNLANDLEYVEMDHLKGRSFFVAVINIDEMQEVIRGKEEEEKYIYNLSIYEWICKMIQSEWGEDDSNDRIEKGYILNYKIDQIVLISFENPKIITPVLEEIIGTALKEKGYSLTVGIGNIYTHLFDLCVSYREASSAATLSRIHGPCVLYSFRDISFDQTQYSKQLQRIVDHKIYNNIKVGAFDEVKQDIADLLAELKASGIDFDAVSTVINNFILMSCKTVNELGYNVKDIFGEDGLSVYLQKDANLTYKDLEGRLYAFYTEVHEFIASKRSNRTEKLVAEIKTYMDENYGDNITLTSLSHKLNISPSYLSVLFREFVSQNFSDYLTNIRIQKAKELLKNTDLRINEIAAKIGYRDAYYFSSVFKKVIGMKPTQYREYLN